MAILNCDVLSQFYFWGLPVLVHKYGDDDDTISYYAHEIMPKGNNLELLPILLR